MYKYFESLKLFNVFLMLITTVLLSGCFATIISGSTQGIKIKIINNSGKLIQGVKCIAKSPYGGGHLLKENPGSVYIKRGSGLLEVGCKKDGYKQSAVMIGESFNEVILLNVLWPFGFAIDVVTGAWKKYPSHYVVIMEESSL